MLRFRSEVWMRVVEIAKRYGVEVRYLPKIPENSGLTPGARYGCDVAAGVVFVAEECRGREDRAAATFLHELVHVIVNPPNRSIWDMHEGWILLQFERLLAQQHLTGAALEDVLDYQTCTSLDLWERDGTHWLILDDCGPNPERLGWWQDGVARIQLLGLVDENQQITWKWPDWSCIDALDLSEWLMQDAAA